MTVGPISIATSAGIFQEYLPSNRSIIPSGMNWRYCDQFCIVMRVPGGMAAGPAIAPAPSAAPAAVAADTATVPEAVADAAGDWATAMGSAARCSDADGAVRAASDAPASGMLTGGSSLPAP